MQTKITFVTPVHNEGNSIFNTIKEFYEIYNDSKFELKFIISEDGSTDNTLLEIEKLKQKYDINLITNIKRKGYSNAVIDAFRSETSDIVCFVDSDGQCDPKDFEKLFNEFNSKNIACGIRSPRKDTIFRKIFSKMFKFLYFKLTKVYLKDPSCPYFVTSKENINKIINTKNIGILTHAFWWEFYARAHHLGIELNEVEINHRERSDGKSVIFKINTIPKIAIYNVKALFELSKILKSFKLK